MRDKYFLKRYYFECLQRDKETIETNNTTMNKDMVKKKSMEKGKIRK